DLSRECASAARRNGYDFTVTTSLSSLPFADDSFDYVVSLDVLGHIEAEQKDAVLAEIKRVLKPGGITMHGIECTDRAQQKSYDEMTAAELQRFIAVDGHVGLEEEQDHAARFKRFFKHVLWKPRYTLCLSSDEILKQADNYGLNFEDDFLDYLRNLSFRERRAFDMAMGYVFGKISDLNISLPKSGLYVFLKASDAELGAFYNQHRDRRGLFASVATDCEEQRCLDRDPEATFDDGWFEPNLLPPVARWMGRSAGIRFRSRPITHLSFDLTTHMPDLKREPLDIQVLLNGSKVCRFQLFQYGWLSLTIPVPAQVINADRIYRLEFRASRTWQPRPTDDQARDDRQVSIAVCNVVINS
ncbi:MAG TPA: methyltransferase domain-containing protein, partial [Pyrinomonadaceae bacterium]|nr:methyltransferase domain-containing protein [Pyrinomonadaceae bacterium]